MPKKKSRPARQQVTDTPQTPSATPEKPPQSTPERPQKPRYVTHAYTKLMLDLSETGKTQREIAAITGYSQETVQHTLALWHDTRELAKRHVYKAATRLSKAVVTGSVRAAEDDHNPEHARKLLQDIEVLPREHAAGADQRTQIVVMMPGGGEPVEAPKFIEVGAVSPRGGDTP